MIGPARIVTNRKRPERRGKGLSINNIAGIVLLV